MQLLLPVTAQIEITDHCNFRCQHCYKIDSDYQPENVEDEKIMAIAQKLAENKVYNLILTGGEPMTHPRLLMQLVEYLTSMNCNLSVNTNLTLLTDELIDCFKKYNVRNLLVSCPSYDQEEYETITRTKRTHGYERFCDNLRKLSDSGLHYTINMVVNQLNKNSIYKTAEFVKSLGSKSFGATPMALNALYPRKDLLLNLNEVQNLLRTLIRVRDELNLEIDVMEALPKCAIPIDLVENGVFFTKRKCQAGLTVCAVSSNGDVRPCTHNTKSYGNILETPLTEIWENMREWRDMTFVPDECKECQLVSACHGACRINAVTMGNGMKGRDIWMQKTLKEVNLKKELIELKPETRLRLINCKLKYRKETDGYTLVFGRNGRQVVLVNDEVVKLIELIADKEMNVSEIAELGGTTAEDVNVQKILRHLISHRLMKVV